MIDGSNSQLKNPIPKKRLGIAIGIPVVVVAAAVAAFLAFQDSMLGSVEVEPVQQIEEESKEPVWEDVSGLWVSSVGAAQQSIDLEDEASEMVWSHNGEMRGGCFFGGGQPRATDYGGFLILFCPAGVDTPTMQGARGNELRFSEVDDVNQDRIWMYQAEGATPWYRS